MKNRRAWQNKRVLFWRALGWTLQFYAFALSGALAFLLRFEFRLTAREIGEMALAVPVWVVGKAIVFGLLSLDGRTSTHASIPDLRRLAVGNVIGSAICAATLVTLSSHFPRSIYFIDFTVFLQFTSAHQFV